MRIYSASLYIILCAYYNYVCVHLMSVLIVCALISYHQFINESRMIDRSTDIKDSLKGIKSNNNNKCIIIVQFLTVCVHLMLTLNNLISRQTLTQNLYIEQKFMLHFYMCFNMTVKFNMHTQ